MAYATQKYEVKKTPNGVTLELTQEEAQTLLDITYKIGGSSELSRRKHTDAVMKALCRAGLVWDNPQDYDESLSFTNSIYFKETM